MIRRTDVQHQSEIFTSKVLSFQVVKCYASSEELQEDPIKVIVSLDTKVAKEL